MYKTNYNYQKILSAFDKNNIEKSCRYAVKICIEVTLELLTQLLSNNLKKLILWTGIGTSLQTDVLDKLWNVSEYDARDTDTLWSYGLVCFIQIMLPAYSIEQHCAEVHAVISQYIIENIDSDEAYGLSPWGRLNTERLVGRGLSESFRRNSGVHDVFSLCTRDYLQHKINKIEYDLFPESLTNISIRTISDPHLIILTLQQAENSLMAIQSNALLIPSFQKETKSLIDDSHKILRSAHRLCRKLNQSIRRCLSEGNYKNLIEQIQLFCCSYPIVTVAQ